MIPGVFCLTNDDIGCVLCDSGCVMCDKWWYRMWHGCHVLGWHKPVQDYVTWQVTDRRMSCCLASFCWLRRRWQPDCLPPSSWSHPCSTAAWISSLAPSCGGATEPSRTPTSHSILEVRALYILLYNQAGDGKDFCLIMAHSVLQISWRKRNSQLWR